jgi:hypothetical protein
VLRIDEHEGLLIADFDGREGEYAFGELDALLPAYAMTIDKSQGSEYPAGAKPRLYRRNARQAPRRHRRPPPRHGDRGQKWGRAAALVQIGGVVEGAAKELTGNSAGQDGAPAIPSGGPL